MYDFEIKLKVFAIRNAFDRQRHVFFYLFAVENVPNNCSKSFNDFAFELR